MDEGKAEPIYLALSLATFRDIQFEQADKDTVAAKVGICDLSGLRILLAGMRWSKSYTYMVIGISEALRVILAAAKDNAGVNTSIFEREFHDWLPQDAHGIHLRSYYPDRSNIRVRKELHRLWDNDPEALTDDGAEEARKFVENDYSWIPF